MVAALLSGIATSSSYFKNASVMQSMNFCLKAIFVKVQTSLFELFDLVQNTAEEDF
jgi:hypothetical protein